MAFANTQRDCLSCGYGPILGARCLMCLMKAAAKTTMTTPRVFTDWKDAAKAMIDGAELSDRFAELNRFNHEAARYEWFNRDDQVWRDYGDGFDAARQGPWTEVLPEPEKKKPDPFELHAMDQIRAIAELVNMSTCDSVRRSEVVSRLSNLIAWTLKESDRRSAEVAKRVADERISAARVKEWRTDERSTGAGQFVATQFTLFPGKD